MKINEVLVEGPFDSMKSEKPAVPDHIAAAKAAGTKSGILKGLDKFAGTNAFGDNKVKPVADLEKDIDRLDDAAKKQLLVKLQQELGQQTTTSKLAAQTTTPAAK
jgi:hypothetical protein